MSCYSLNSVVARGVASAIDGFKASSSTSTCPGACASAIASFGLDARCGSVASASAGLDARSGYVASASAGLDASPLLLAAFI